MENESLRCKEYPRELGPHSQTAVKISPLYFLLRDYGTDSNISKELVEINDMYSSDETKIEEISSILAKKGIELEVIDGTHSK